MPAPAVFGDSSILRLEGRLDTTGLAVWEQDFVHTLAVPALVGDVIRHAEDQAEKLDELLARYVSCARSNNQGRMQEPQAAA